MADPAAVIAAVAGGVATVLTAWSAYKSARMADRMKALEQDHARGAKDTGQRLIGLIDKMNTLDDRTQAAQRRIERIPTESQWSFRMGQTPTERVTVVPQNEPLKGPKPPKVAPYPWPEDEEDR
jgi:hypothetical protein